MSKGDKGQECFRTACHRKLAYFYNSSTGRYYCQSCAIRINDAVRNILCTISEEDKVAHKKARRRVCPEFKTIPEYIGKYGSMGSHMYYKDRGE